MADHNFTGKISMMGGWGELWDCSFVTNGTSAPTGFTSDGGVVSVTRTGVGTFELTFAKSWVALQPVGFVVGGAAAVQLGRPTVRSITRSTRKMVIATVESDAAPVDIETTGVTIYATFKARLA